MPSNSPSTETEEFDFPPNLSPDSRSDLDTAIRFYVEQELGEVEIMDDETRKTTFEHCRDTTLEFLDALYRKEDRSTPDSRWEKTLNFARSVLRQLDEDTLKSSLGPDLEAYYHRLEQLVAKAEALQKQGLGISELHPSVPLTIHFHARKLSDCIPGEVGEMGGWVDEQLEREVEAAKMRLIERMTLTVGLGATIAVWGTGDEKDLDYLAPVVQQNHRFRLYNPPPLAQLLKKTERFDTLLEATEGADALLVLARIEHESIDIWEEIAKVMRFRKDIFDTRGTYDRSGKKPNWQALSMEYHYPRS